MRSAWYKPQHHLHSNCAKITILKIQQILQNQILLTLSAHYKQPWWRNQLFSGNYFSRSEETIWTQGSCLPCFFHRNLYLAWRHTVFFPSPFFFQKFHLNVDQCEVISIKALPIDIQLKRDISSLSQGSKSSKLIRLHTSDEANIYPREFITVWLNCLITTGINDR